MLAKDALRGDSVPLPDPHRYLADAGGAPTPQEYMWARWWDAAMLPYFRLGFGSPPYRTLDDDGAGTFDASFRCHRIRRAIDNSYRYNEIIGILTDYAHGETCNEALLAVAAGGLRALTGYATACARVVDDVLACDCGESGHEEVAETAMGALAWYVVTPRYDVRAQLHALSTTGGDCQQLAPLWRELFLTAAAPTTDTATPAATDTTAAHDVVTRLAGLTSRIWEHTIAGPGIAPWPGHWTYWPATPGSNSGCTPRSTPSCAETRPPQPIRPAWN
ncbi:hypothetical protein PUR28_10165 [Streptomyces sp. BE308]|uniref:hypothetical protein n=1 Tax=Streptomyces sp. BE308 TaxID=3002529 RepID=UPI002E795773|nr:hypothetical protein [Streptomyces sp. BE308]MEE1791129.1 hypothetical protein [Streptomyces sp. BE308]